MSDQVNTINYGCIYYMLKKGEVRSYSSKGKPVLVITPDEINHAEGTNRVAIVPISGNTRASESTFYVPVEWKGSFTGSTILASEIFICDKEVLHDCAERAPESTMKKVKSCVSTFLEIGAGFELDEGFVVSKDAQAARDKGIEHHISSLKKELEQKSKELEELKSRLETIKRLVSVL